MQDSITQHQVLARKYRPQNFSSLKGQEVLVRTLSNAILQDRLANAFLLTGIRGIGKTTTARIIAQTINCTDIQINNGLPESCFVCPNCQEVKKFKHQDIIEIDAASKTGVGDIRELIDHANYLPLIGRYKVYIIDEVHMLSSAAFNALLKILEEPPSHVKFIFATTELKKIPITILSRCQRFDLKRLNKEEMVNHLQDICNLEKITIEPKGLQIIALKSEGSVRDALSLLDQLIAYANNGSANIDISSQMIETALSLVNSEELLNLFEFIVAGNIEEALQLFKLLYLNNIDPLNIFEELLHIINLVTKIKTAPNLVDLIVKTEIFEILALQSLAEKISVMSLTSLWQMLLKGMQELVYAPNNLSAAEMLLIRICYSSNLPNPEELIKQIKTGKTVTVAEAKPLPVLSNIATKNIASFEDLVQEFYQQKEFVIYHYLMEDVKLVQFEPGKLVFNPDSHLPKDLPQQIATLLKQWTSINWAVSIARSEGNTTLGEQKDLEKEKLKQMATHYPEVKNVLELFPDAKIVDVHSASKKLI